jgi:general secretion pathway protein D
MRRFFEVFSAATFRHRGVFAAVILSSLLGLGTVRAFGDAANDNYKRGQEAEARQDYDTAYNFYTKAVQLNAKDLRYRTAYDRIRTTDSNMHLTKGRSFQEAGDTQAALTEFLHVVAIDPGNEAARQEIARIRKQQGQAAQGAEVTTPAPKGDESDLASMASPVELKPTSNEPLTLHMTEDSKVIYQAIGKAAGINVLFDQDYNSKRVQVDLNGVSLMDALRIVGAMSNTFWRPITSNTIFVAQNTRVKRTELDEQAVQTFYLSNAWQQNDLNDVQTALRNVLPNAKVYGVASQNAIVMRGTPDELLLAQKLINDLDKARSEVVVDFGVLEVSKHWERSLGIAWPGSISVQLTNPTTTTSSSSSSSSGTGTSTTTNNALTLSNIKNLNSNDFQVTVGPATLNLLLNDNNTQILEDPRIRATDGQKATLTVGSKIPIATGSYQTGAATALVSSLVNTQFQYIDVGVKIEMTPTVHYGNDVTLKVHIEVSAQSGSVTISGVTEPILSQRVADQVIRLKEGEASILGGIQNSQLQLNWTGIPGLSSIPVFKYLFGSRDHVTDDDEIVFVVIPHVVRGPDLDEQNLRAVDTGEGQSIELRKVATVRLPNAAIPGSSVGAAGGAANGTQSFIGTVPASTAPAAAVQALDQLRANQATAGPPPAPAATPAMNAANPPLPTANEVPGVSAAPTGTAAAGGLGVALAAPPGAVPAGTTFQVPINLSNGTDVASVPVQFQYDPAKLTLVNVTSGDFLSKDGQATALIHRDDGPGNVTVVASRPPGAAGVSGSGTVCVLSFQAKSAGATNLNMTRAGIMNSKQQQVQAQPTQANVVVK